MAKVKTLKEIAKLIPPGIVGMQLDADERPYSLVFRAETVNDPRKKLLDGSGWFQVFKQPEVLYAAATLEAYNYLIDSGIEFKQTAMVERWWQEVNSDAPQPWMPPFADCCPLFDYQREAAYFLARRPRALLALSPGLGKTLTAAYSATMLSEVKNILLVVPASLLHYWKGELAKWSEHLLLTPTAEIWHREVGELPSQTKPRFHSQFWAITNPETMARYTDAIVFNEEGLLNPWDLLVVDESIMYKHRESKRSQALLRLAEAIPRAWLLSGAPATRYLDDMWHQFHILNSRGYASYQRFAENYCKTENNEWARTVVVANKRGAEEEIKANYRDVYFARSQDQVANIPDWLFVDMNIAMTPYQEKLYREFKQELLIRIKTEDEDKVITADNRLTIMLRSLQLASNPVLLGGEDSGGKWEALPELMDLYEGPYLVWINFIRSGEMLRDKLAAKYGKDRVFMANGATPMADRQLLVDNYQAGNIDVLILNNQVGKFGFTITKARTSLFVERMFDDSYFQCLHRNRRIGTTQSPVVLNLRSVTQRGGRTTDHIVHDSLDYRNLMIRNITYGDLRKVLEDE